MNCCNHIILVWTVQGLKSRRNIIDKSAAVSGAVYWSFSSLWINKLPLFPEVTYALNVIPPCCIFSIPGLYIFIGVFIILSHSRPLLACLLCHYLFDNRYALFSFMGWFNLFWVSHIPGWKIGRHDTWWMTCSSIVSGFVIFTHRLFVYQMWMLLKNVR